MITKRAYAKINLFLDVISKREDGFHDIKSIMQSLSLCDELSFSFTESDKTEVKLSIVGNDSLPTDKSNLIVKALLAYLSEVNRTLNAEITLKKNIPSSAGLGGGSSDAAATLLALNEYFNGQLAESELLSLAGKIGSDVPFCLCSGTALCEGRGERITRLPSPKRSFFVVAIGKGGVSTPRAYAALDRLYSDFKSPRSETDLIYQNAEKALSLGKIDENSLYNIFEDVICPELAEVDEIKKIMTASGALGSLMSGSGPSVFGMFESESEALSARDHLLKLGYSAYACESV